MNMLIALLTSNSNLISNHSFSKQHLSGRQSDGHGQGTGRHTAGSLPSGLQPPRASQGEGSASPGLPRGTKCSGTEPARLPSFPGTPAGNWIRSREAAVLIHTCKHGMSKSCRLGGIFTGCSPMPSLSIFKLSWLPLSQLCAMTSSVYV